MAKQRKPVVFPGHKSSDARKHYESGAGRQVTTVEPPEGGWDSFYVPGFSEHRHMNNLSQTKQGRAAGIKFIPLPADLAWLRATGDQRDIQSGTQRWLNEGYFFINDVTVDAEGRRRSPTLEKHGWGVPPQCMVGQDGTMRVQDTVLAYCPGDRHYENVKKHEEFRRFREGRQETPMGTVVDTEESEQIEVDSSEIRWAKP